MYLLFTEVEQMLQFNLSFFQRNTFGKIDNFNLGTKVYIISAEGLFFLVETAKKNQDINSANSCAKRI